jgi:hypothetical protein
MRKFFFGRIILLAICILVFGTLLTSQIKIQIGPGYQKQESFQVKSVLVDWTYTDRRGEIPVKIYYPVTRQRQNYSFPVIIFSHDLNRTQDEFEYLGQHWAGRGYVSVHLPQYNEDNRAWKGSLKPEKEKGYIRRSVKNQGRDWRRDNDIDFAIDRLTMMNRDDRTFRGMFNMNYIGIVGDYYDMDTAMRVAGNWAAVSSGPRRAYNTPCVRAIILLSEPMQSRRSYGKTYTNISIPVLEMSEAQMDNDAYYRSQRRGDRRQVQNYRPYTFSTEKDIYHIMFNVAEYMIFSGDRHRDFGKDKRDVYHMSFIKDITSAFWDAYLKNDRQAKQWLRKGAFDNYYDGYDYYDRDRRHKIKDYED